LDDNDDDDDDNDNDIDDGDDDDDDDDSKASRYVTTPPSRYWSSMNKIFVSALVVSAVVPSYTSQKVFFSPAPASV
jgi:hypothetical protein